MWWFVNINTFTLCNNMYTVYIWYKHIQIWNIYIWQYIYTSYIIEYQYLSQATSPKHTTAFHYSMECLSSWVPGTGPGQFGNTEWKFWTRDQRGSERYMTFSCQLIWIAGIWSQVSDFARQFCSFHIWVNFTWISLIDTPIGHWGDYT